MKDTVYWPADMKSPEITSFTEAHITSNGQSSSGAALSPCRKYRYLLWRSWHPNWTHKRCPVFIGLNPSTADAIEDDSTVRRCIGFAKSWGHGGVYLVNLFGWRAKSPHDMVRAKDPVGPENDEHIMRFAHDGNLLVAAWGTYGAYKDRGFTVGRALIAMGIELQAFGVNANGQPKHPLYLKKTAQLYHWVLP